MKIASSFARVLCLSLAVAGPLRAADEPAPAVTIQRALELAQDALAHKHAPADVFIKSIVLKSTTLTGPNRIWEVAWSTPLPATLPGSKDLGLEISMAGDVVHLVKGKAAK